MMLGAVCDIAVEIHSDKDKRRDGGEEWKSTQDVVVISIEVFVVVGHEPHVE